MGETKGTTRNVENVCPVPSFRDCASRLEKGTAQRMEALRSAPDFVAASTSLPKSPTPSDLFEGLVVELPRLPRPRVPSRAHRVPVPGLRVSHHGAHVSIRGGGGVYNCVGVGSELASDVARVLVSNITVQSSVECPLGVGEILPIGEGRAV